jgi:hypothetical protein
LVFSDNNLASASLKADPTGTNVAWILAQDQNALVVQVGVERHLHSQTRSGINHRH